MSSRPERVKIILEEGLRKLKSTRKNKNKPSKEEVKLEQLLNRYKSRNFGAGTGLFSAAPKPSRTRKARKASRRT